MYGYSLHFFYNQHRKKFLNPNSYKKWMKKVEILSREMQYFVSLSWAVKYMKMGQNPASLALAAVTN